jgi:hypothetical protein
MRTAIWFVACAIFSLGGYEQMEDLIASLFAIMFFVFLSLDAWEVINVRSILPDNDK